MQLRFATPADIPFIMQTEQQPGYNDYVGRWTAEAHAAAMAQPDHRYFIGESAAGQPLGFAMLQQLGDPYGNLLFRRIAVSTRGQGDGDRLFRLVRDWVFRETPTHRLFLNCYRHNQRGYRVYTKAGFIEEGAAREARLLSDGSRVDTLTLSLLRREWEALSD